MSLPDELLRSPLIALLEASETTLYGLVGGVLIALLEFIEHKHFLRVAGLRSQGIS